MHSTPPGIMEQVMKWIETFLPTLFAAGVAFGISLLMSIYDGRISFKAVCGALACSIFVMALSGSLEFFGMPGNAATVLGAFVGFSGVERIRNKVISIVESKTGGTQNANKQ